MNLYLTYALAIVYLATFSNCYKIDYTNGHNKIHFENNRFMNGKPVNEPKLDEAIQTLSKLGFKPDEPAVEEEAKLMEEIGEQLTLIPTQTIQQQVVTNQIDLEKIAQQQQHVLNTLAIHQLNTLKTPASNSNSEINLASKLVPQIESTIAATAATAPISIINENSPTTASSSWSLNPLSLKSRKMKAAAPSTVNSLTPSEGSEMLAGSGYQMNGMMNGMFNNGQNQKPWFQKTVPTKPAYQPAPAAVVAIPTETYSATTAADDKSYGSSKVANTDSSDIFITNINENYNNLNNTETEKAIVKSNTASANVNEITNKDSLKSVINSKSR
jgi:hypothetical protein